MKKNTCPIFSKEVAFQFVARALRDSSSANPFHPRDHAAILRDMRTILERDLSSKQKVGRIRNFDTWLWEILIHLPSAHLSPDDSEMLINAFNWWWDCMRSYVHEHLYNIIVHHRPTIEGYLVKYPNFFSYQDKLLWFNFTNSQERNFREIGCQMGLTHSVYTNAKHQLISRCLEIYKISKNFTH